MVFKKSNRKFKKIKNKWFPTPYQKIRLYYGANYDKKPIDDNLILYETRDGKSIVDSPFAFFLELVNNKDYSHFKHVWVIDKTVENIKQSIPTEYLNRVVFVERGSIPYVDAMLQAKFLISNSTFDSFFKKRKGQIYINTWHGTPLKFMGFDIPGYVNHSQNVMRNFLMADYIISPNQHTSNIFINSYRLKGIYPGKILEGGYPRIDFTLNTDKKRIEDKIKQFGATKLTGLPILLFSPTWKGNSVNNAQDEIDQIIEETLTLANKFHDIYNVLVKVHPFIYDKIKGDERIKAYLISDLIDANEVLSVTELLITDYSSIFFDYLVTKKPIIFYSWDNDLYEQDRGMYFSIDELPGPIAENINELIELIEQVDNNKKEYQDKYARLSSQIIPYENGRVTKKYIDYLFGKNEQKDIEILEINSDKKKLIFYPGGMRNNGITSSFLNLINNIDYEKYDVTVITNSTRNKEINDNLKLINANARILFRFGSNILNAKERKKDQQLMKTGLLREKRNTYPTNGYNREMNRLTSNISFDVAIDFSGYSYFWGRHILGVDAKKYVVFMHNDLMADSMREINGKTPMKDDLHGLFTLYYKFDKLLSVSPMTRDVNREKLANFVTEDQMSYVYNSINIDQILDSQKHGNQVENKTLTTKKELRRVSETSQVKVFKNIESVKENIYDMTNLTKDKKVVQYATFEYKNATYAKVSVEGLYIGWIKANHLRARPFEITRKDKFHGFGTVARALTFPIWKEVRHNDETDQIVAYVGQFKNRYLEIIDSCATEVGLYYKVKYMGVILGWVSSKPLARIHKTSKLSPLNKYFLNRMKKMDALNPVHYSYKVDNQLNLFVKFKTNLEVELWSKPCLTIGAFKLPFSDDYYNNGFKVKQKLYFKNKTYCCVTLDDGSFLGFVDESMLVFISEEEYQVLNVSEKKQEYGLSILPKLDLNSKKVPKFDSNYFNLISMGRLSPEKNQKELINAFKQFNEDVPKSRLYILGKGPLQRELVDQIKRLELEGKVILLGHISQPFEFIKLNDYFVLPSIYEGQPMVLLESLTLGLNILASNIPANINVIGKDETYGLLTNGTTCQAIYEGLVRAFEFRGTFKSFDYYEYNKKAMNSFYREIS